jgi:hypothetical protein
MGFRFSRRVSILPGLKLNLSGSGVSLSAGVRGAHINLGPRGQRQQQWSTRQAQQPPADDEQAAMLLFYSPLDEQQRRLYAGLESLEWGHGGDQRMAHLFGLDAETVARAAESC